MRVCDWTSLLNNHQGCVRWWNFVLVVAAGQAQLFLFYWLMIYLTCTVEDALHFASQKPTRVATRLLFNHLTHKPVPLPFILSNCSCVIRSSPRRLFTSFHVAHFTTEHLSTSPSAEAAADASTNTSTTPTAPNCHRMSQLRK